MIAALLISVPAIFGQSEAASPQIIGLEQCKALALQNNAAMRTATDKLESAHQVSRQAFTKYFPSVSAVGMGFKTNRHVLRFDVADLMTVGLIKDGLLGGITATQPVFAGGQIVNGNRLASVGEEAGRLELERTSDEVCKTVEQYYWSLMALKQKKQTLESVMNMIDTLYHQVDLYVKAGVAINNDLLKVRLAKNQYATDMVDLDNGIALSRKLLLQYIGCYGQNIDFETPDISLDTSVTPGEIYVEPSSAVYSTPAYGLLDAQVRAAQLREKMEAGKLLPTVGVGGGLYYSDLLQQHNTFGSIFVAVSIPISDWWGGSHAVRKSKIDTRVAMTERDDLSQMLELGMNDAWDKLTAAQRKMEIARLSVVQSDENLRVNHSFYEAGTVTISDLLDAQMLYRKSRDEFSEAYYNFCIERAAYLAITSQISTK